MKKYMAILLGILLVLTVTLAAAENAAPLTAEELSAWANELKEKALSAEPENDPESENSDTEDGYLFQYRFGTLYADRTEMIAETAINAAAITGEDAAVRGIRAGMDSGEVIALFANDNPELAGDQKDALLYMREEDGVLRYGRVYRDGQRIGAIEYGELAPSGDGYRWTMLSCSFRDGYLYEVRTEGLEGNAPVISADEKLLFAESLGDLGLKTEYRAVKTSRNGSELEPFGRDDLDFGGIHFLNLRPNDLPGIPETEEIDNEDGTTLLRVDGEGYVAVFQKRGDGKIRVVSLSLTDDSMEGPRCVRLGDAFYQDMQRFRFEDRGSDDNNTEMLYGSETGDRGLAEYGNIDGITLRYITVLDDNTEVELLLRYNDEASLAELILHIL